MRVFIPLKKARAGEIRGQQAPCGVITPCGVNQSGWIGSATRRAFPTLSRWAPEAEFDERSSEFADSHCRQPFAMGEA